MADTDLHAAALALLDRANADPPAVIAQASTLAASAEADAATRAIALRAAGLAQRVSGDLRASLASLRHGVEVAEDGGHGALAAAIRTTLAASLAYAGEFDHALDELGRAEPLLDDADRARAGFQRGGILQRLGQPAEAIACYDRALPALEASGDTLFTAHLLANRGLLRCYAADTTGARADMEAASERYLAADQPAASAAMVNNLGFVATRAGDLVTALARFDEASRAYAALGLDESVIPLDRCEALLAAGLVDDAANLAASTAAALRREGMQADLAEALLLHAQASLLGDRFDTASTSAAEAERLLNEQGRDGWAAVANRIRLDAAVGIGRATVDTAVAAAESADRLDAAGQVAAALSARLLAARIHADLGDAAAAHGVLDTASVRFRPPTALEIELWLTRASVRLADGNRTGADAAARSGMRVLDRQRSALSSADLRSHVGLHGRALASLGLRLAVESGNADRVLRWLEWTRARALQFPATHPPDDSGLAGLLVDYRTVAADLAAGERENAPVGALLQRLHHLREQINRMARRRADTTEVPPVMSSKAMAARLGDRRLLEFGVLDGHVVAVSLHHGRLRLAQGPALVEVSAQLDRMRLLLTRLALAHAQAPRSDDDEVRRQTDEQLRRVATRIDGMLLSGLGLDGPATTVVVPSAALGEVPWALLPSVGDPAPVVAPSASLWAEPVTTPPRRVVLVAGPRLALADAEIEAVAGVYDDPVVRIGDRATVAEVLADLADADIAHFACHGRFEPRQPLFSSLELADGHLTLHDIDRLEQAPRLVILSACRSAESARLPGDELLGLPGGFLNAGASAVVAGNGLVPDTSATIAAMRAMHEHLVAGDRPADALVAAGRNEDGEGDDDGVAPAVRFTVFGAG